MTNRHCETCKYWEPPNGNGEGKWGTCLLISELGGKWRNDQEAAIEVLAEGDPFAGARLRTTADFGCTEYESIIPNGYHE